MMKGQIAGLMKQAQAMQENLKRAQDELALVEVEGQSGAGLVKVTMTCKHDVKRIHIDKHAIQRRDISVLTIQTSDGEIKAAEITIKGDSKMCYRPYAPLKCGARVWLETRAEVTVDK